MPTAVLEPEQESRHEEAEASAAEVPDPGAIDRYARDAAQSTFDIWIDPGNATQEELADLLAAFSAVTLAAGGTGLRFYKDDADFRSFEGRL